MKTNERHICLSSRRGVDADAVGVRGAVMQIVAVESESIIRGKEVVDDCSSPLSPAVRQCLFAMEASRQCQYACAK